MIGEIVSLLFMAIALGMDAFSVSLGVGMQKIRLKRIFIAGIVIGLYHVIMPFIGIILGQAISNQIGELTTLLGGLLLVGIGTHMMFSAFNHVQRQVMKTAGFGLFIFALSVSLDSFSVGLGLGMSGVKVAVALILFGTVSTILTWLGMLIGRKVGGYLGVYSEILGGSILWTFGLYIIFG